MDNYIPRYIREAPDKEPGSVVTADEYNSILQLLVAQGDYNSEFLNDTHQLYNEWLNTPPVPGPQGPTGPTGPGIATGGTAGQILTKKSGTDYDTEWIKTIITTLGSDHSTVPTSKAVKDVTDTKQETLSSGVNIKTINNETLLGAGDLTLTVPEETPFAEKNLLIDSTFATDAHVLDASFFNTEPRRNTSPQFLALRAYDVDNYFYISTVIGGYELGDKIYLHAYVQGQDTYTVSFLNDTTVLEHNVSADYVPEFIRDVITISNASEQIEIIFQDTASSDWGGFLVYNIVALNLTKIYGVGNEPTANQMLTDILLANPTGAVLEPRETVAKYSGYILNWLQGPASGYTSWNSTLQDMYWEIADARGEEGSVLDHILNKQDVLVSGTNIKTINSNSLLGSGDIAINPNISYLENALTIDVPLTNSTTYYDGPAITLTPGTWLVIGRIVHFKTTTTAAQVFGRLTDGTNYYDHTQQYHPSAASSGENLYLQSIITVANNTSVKLQCAVSSGAVSSFMKATINMGSGAKATRITAIKLS